ncbi:MAG: TIGR03009 domain-containing protein [Lacipirellulaceae bacterium]
MFNFLRAVRLAFAVILSLVTAANAQTSPYQQPAQQRSQNVAATPQRYPQVDQPQIQQTQATTDARIADSRGLANGGVNRQPSYQPLDQRQPAGQLGQPIAPGVQQAVQAPPQQAPPFQLTDVERQFVRQILEMWENRSNEVKTFNADFVRWEYNHAFGGVDRAMTQSDGQLTYSKPDKGSFYIKKIHRWVAEVPKNTAKDAPGNWVEQKNEVGEHWVCDGKAIYEYVQRAKELRVQSIPPEMRGEAIVNGPLPFLFGAKADDLERRYWIRSKQSDPETIWLEAYPRWQADAANYRMVDVMLDRKTMLPKAIQVHEPNGQSRSAYMFKSPTINGKLDGLLGNIFSAPRTPLGWKRVVEPAPAAAQGSLPQAKQSQAIQR